MVVGMLTVFAVLWLVVASAQALIRLTNRIQPDIPSARPAPVVDLSPLPSKKPDPKTLAAILASVETITQGKGRVKSVKAVNQTTTK